MADSSPKWWLALGGAALLVSASLGGLAVLRKNRAMPAARPTVLAPPGTATTLPANPAPPPSAESAAGCGPQRSDFHPLPDAESPPVILWAAGDVRLFVDEQAAFSSPEAPRRFKPGEHAVRIEATGAEPIQTRIRIDPFTPALLHAQVDLQLGLSLVRLGAACSSCAPRAKPLDLVPVKSPNASFAMIQAAAGHLRHDQWQEASDGIRKAAPADRKNPTFYRLAAITAADAGDVKLAKALLKEIPAAKSKDLATLMPVLNKLAAAEDEHRKGISLERWNKLTEWFASINANFQGEGSGPVLTATKRFAELSTLFDGATRKGALEQQAEVVRAGEQALTELVRSLRALKPADCRFQVELSKVVSK